mgnify:CR=1 FL=1
MKLKDIDIFSRATDQAPADIVIELHKKTRKRYKSQEAQSTFPQDCENILYHLTNYNFDYSGPVHDLGANIVFIVGIPRCGKTTIEKLLSGTGAFECHDELYFLRDMLGQIIGPDGLEYVYPEYLPKMMDQIFPDMAKDFIARLREQIGETDKFITNTMPANFLYIPLLKKMLPRCKIIWCHRNRQKHLAALYSKEFKNILWYFTDDVEVLLEAYELYYHVYDLYKSKLPNGFLDVEFDNTLINPEKTLRSVLDFIELEYDDGVVEKTIEANKEHIAKIRYIDDNIKKYLVYLPEFL